MLARLTRRLSALSPAWVGGAVALVVVVMGTGALIAYRTYDWVEHDNEFCLSCHLMAEPYEAFAQSAHRDLGCKACHKPTFGARSEMALTQVLENPDSLEAHAEVTNEKCASCHIDGDPERWAIVAASAGHRVHLESDDPVLEGLQCVQCHSSGIHEFSASAQTCGQSACHADTDITLGGMGALTIHCTACHGFSTPVREDSPAVVRAALQPQAEECLSCHVMRTLIELPPDEPHQGACGACHNPHEQDTPEEAVATCATAGCHEDVEPRTPMHRGLDPGVLANCSSCHAAHEFRVDGQNCAACHTDEAGTMAAGVRAPARVASLPADHPPSPALAASAAHPRLTSVQVLRALRGGVGAARATVRPPAAAVRPPVAPPVPARHPPIARPGAPPGASKPVALQPVAASAVAAPAVAMRAVAVRPVAAPPVAARQVALLLQVAQDRAATPDSTFRHTSHRSVACAQCHSSEQSHGQVTVTALADCRSCHHSGPVANDCQSCHLPASVPTDVFRAVRAFDLSVGAAPRRPLPFEHAPHARVACATCHAEGPARPAAAADCASCHVEHHGPDAPCMSCHVEAPASVHPVAQVHVGCTGAGCHTETPFAGMPRTRALCLTCHQEMAEHRPEANCVPCHQLPAATGTRR